MAPIRHRRRLRLDPECRSPPAPSRRCHPALCRRFLHCHRGQRVPCLRLRPCLVPQVRLRLRLFLLVLLVMVSRRGRTFRCHHCRIAPLPPLLSRRLLFRARLLRVAMPRCQVFPRGHTGGRRLLILRQRHRNKLPLARFCRQRPPRRRLRPAPCRQLRPPRRFPRPVSRHRVRGPGEYRGPRPSFRLPCHRPLRRLRCPLRPRLPYPRLLFLSLLPHAHRLLARFRPIFPLLAPSRLRRLFARKIWTISMRRRCWRCVSALRRSCACRTVRR